jgi:RHS repeat-associated protein
MPRRQARSRGRRGPNFVHLGLERLEGRCLLTAVSWTGAGDGTSWTNPANWSTNALPGPADDVTISISGNPTIQISSGIQSINSLVTSDLVKLTGGTLQVGTTAQIGANLTLAGGTILGGTFSETGGAVISLSTSGGTLDGVTVNGVIDAATQSGNATVYDGLTLNGTLSLGNAGGSTSGQILFGDSTHAAGGLTGTGTVVFGASSSDSINNNSNLGGASGTLTFGPNITIQGGSGSMINDFTTGSIVNQGAIDAGASAGTILLGSTNGNVTNQGSIEVVNGASLTIADLVNQSGATVTATGSTLTLGGSLSNLGTITVTNSTVNLTGSLSQANLGTFNRSGGTVNVTGNVNGNLTLDAGTGSWNFLAGSSLSDGTLTQSGGATAGFAPTGGLLARETIGGDFNLTLAQNGSITVIDSLTVTGNLRLGNATGTTSAVVILGTGAEDFGSKSPYDNTGVGGYHISSDTVLTVGGQIIFGSSTGNGIINNNLNFIPKPGPNDPPAVLSYSDMGATTYLGGSKIEISGAIQGGVGSIANFYSRSTIQVDTSVIASGANSSISVGGSGSLGVTQNSLINKGTLQAINGATLALGDLTQSTGTVSVNGAALQLFDSLANNSTITATNSTVDLHGTFTQAGLGTFNSSGSIVDLSGTLSGGLTLDASTGSWFLHAGTVLGGAVSESGGAELAFTQFGGILKNGVTFNGDMDLDAGLNASLQASPIVNVDGGLTLNGTMYLGNTASSAFGTVIFGDNLNAPGSLVGTGTVVFGGTRVFGNSLFNGWVGTGSQTLTIGPNITIRGQSGSLQQQAGTTGNTIVVQGTISADVAGGTIQLGTFGPVVNQGSIQVINGGTISGVGLINSAGKTITVTNSTLSLSSNWSNNGTIVATNSTLNLAGSFTRATLGNFVRTGGTVNLTGTLYGGLNLDAANGSWTLVGGTINGGAVNTSGGSQLILSNFGGTLAGVTVNGNVDATQQSAQATFTGGLVLNGTITMGSGTNNSATLYFGGFNVAAGSLIGNGTIVFGFNQGGGNVIDNNSNLSGASGTLTIGPHITIEGKTGGFRNSFASGAIINEGRIVAADPAGTISISTGGGTFSNQGTMQANGGTFSTLGTIGIDGAGTLSTDLSGSFSVGGSILGNSTAFASSNPQGVTTLNGGFSPGNPLLLEVMSQDLGNTAAGFKNNFVYGTINVAGDVRLVDQFANAPGGPNALYANSLLVSAGTLDLNGLHVYARAVQINNGASVVNGTITQFPDGGQIDINSAVPGTISPAGDQDIWTFFGRSGEAVTAYVNPGTGTVPAPITPNLIFAGIQLIAPNNSVLASGNSAAFGAAVSLPNITLPTDGVYSIKISAATGHTNTATGNYAVAVWDVTPQIQPLLLGQPTNGSIRTPFDIQQWTFSALAGEQVQFHLINSTSTGIVYSLTGPNNFAAFSNASGDSPLINLPSSGTYTLSASGVNGATGHYAFAVNPTTQTDLPLGGLVNGTLAGSGQAELFTIAVPAVQTLITSLTDPASNDSNELYLRFGSPPTRETFDYRYTTANSANQTITIPNAAIGTWYVLVYGNYVPVASTFSLSAGGVQLQLNDVLPKAIGNAAPMTLRLTGDGFEPGTTVSLVGPGNTQIPATSVNDVSFTQLVATFPQGLPAGVYSVVVNQGASSSTLPGALTISAGGAAHLQTGLQVPAALGRHIASTLYVTYANDGTVAMPAPLLVLQSTDPVQVPLMTLDPSRISPGLVTTRVPDGYSTSLMMLANGAVPGILEPGESFTVPVYWGGLEQPWDLTHTTIPMSLGAVDTSGTDTIDWNSLKSSLQPPDIPNGAWNSVFSTLVAQLGSTSGQFVGALDTSAAYLGGLGQNVNDVDKLFGFMIAQADAELGPAQTLASASDAILPLPNAASLGFERDYQQAIGSRYTAGILGLGWQTSWQLALSKNSDGSIGVGFGGQLTATFQPDSSKYGGFVSPLQGETLTATGGGTYTLTQRDGTFAVFGASGLLAYEQDTNGNRLTLTYNGTNQLTAITASSGQSLTLAYNAAGRLASLTDSAGRVTTYSYDPSNQFLLSVTGSDGTISYAYDATTNALTSITHPDGTHTFYSYDAQGRVAGTSADGGAGAIAFTYNGLGEVTATNALGDATQSFYDAAGFPVKGVDGLGNPVYSTFDSQGNLLSLTDAAGDTSTYTYDAAGNLLTATDPLHAVTQFTYGAMSRLASFTDPNGNVTHYAYDANGNLTTATYADGSGAAYTYDPLGDPISYVNRNGQPATMTYNASGQTAHETFADGSHYDYTYDARNNLLTASDATGITTFTYDSADRMTSVSYPGGKSLTFTYDAGGRRTSMVDQSGYTVNYAYTPAGDLSQLTDGSNQPVVTYHYDAARRLQEQDNANGTFTTYEYDAAGNLMHLVNHAPGGAANSRFDYTYDLRGQETSMATLDGSWTYSYDADGQLVRAVFTSTNPSLPNQDLAYNYDPNGNRTSTVINGVTTAYVTNALNQYTSIGGTTQQYDADGNLIFDGTNTYTYDQLDELTGVSNAQGATQYVYNALGQRVSTIAGGQTTQFVNDPLGLGNVVGTYDGAGSLVAHFDHGLTLVSQLTAAGARYFYDFDATGSTAGLTDATGSYVNRYRYLPFGESQSVTAATANSFQFVGAFGVQAEGGGLSFMRARFYSTAVGRFTSSDPLQLGGGDTNFYRYAANQPVQFVDPSGQIIWFTNNDLELGDADTYYHSTVYNYNWPPVYSYGYDPTLSADENEQVALKAQIDAFDKSITHDTAELDDMEHPKSVDFLPFDISRVLFGLPANFAVMKVIDWALPGPHDLHDQLAEDLRRLKAEQRILELKFLALNGLNLEGTIFGLSRIASAVDPNDKIGPGFGPSGFVAAGTALPYRVDFENDPSATAPAQQVVITDQLSSNLDWSSFRLNEVGWGDTEITVPANSQHFQTTVPMTFNGESFNVEVQIGIDLATGLITAQFFSIDPVTSLPPDVLTGFLPPEDGTGRGMGHISYTISPIAGLPTGTQIRNVADVSFDEQPIIATDQVSETDPTQGTDPAKEALVTIDAGPPTSSVAALPPTEASTTFTVNWSGQDDAGGSGIGSYNVYVSDSGGAYMLFQSNTTATSAAFTGQDFHTYAFYCVATDNVGNQQSVPTAPQATTYVNAPIPVTSTSDSGPGSLRQALLDAAGAPGQTHTIQFALPAGSQTISLLSSLPDVTDPLIALVDATQNVTIDPSSATAWNDNSSLTLTGAGTLTISGGIEGTGNLTVNAGNSLTAGHIIQSALVIGGTAGSPATVTIAASDANGNPLNSVGASDTRMTVDAMANSPQPAPPTAGSASAVATASPLTATTASSEPPISVAVAANSRDSFGSTLAVNSNSSDSAGLIALQSSRETFGALGLAYSASNEGERLSSLTATGVASTSDAATFLERQTAITKNGNSELLHCDAVGAAFADADVLEWAAFALDPRPPAADADFSLLSDDLLDAIGRHWHN